MTRTYDPALDTRPAAPGQPINLADLKDILGKAIKHEDLRQGLMTDPEATLRAMNYEPHPDAVTFFRSLAATNFASAADGFRAAHPDPSIGMAEA